jgi:hypothetical protein
MLKRIHVNQHHIRANAQDGGVTINGPSRVVYRPDTPLSCGARLWVETEADVETTV